MDKHQIKLLKEIKKSELFDYTNFSKEEKDVLFFLASQKFVAFKNDPERKNRRLCKITERGKSELSSITQKKIYWLIPMVTSIFAAISAYRQEIYLLIQAIVRLLK